MFGSQAIQQVIMVHIGYKVGEKKKKKSYDGYNRYEKTDTTKLHTTHLPTDV